MNEQYYLGNPLLKKSDVQHNFTKQEIEKEVKDPTTVNNSLFIGSTAELQELLNKKK